MAGTGSGRTYSIKEVAALVGLPASTLRYYEDVSVIPAIARDASSGHRTYTEDDLELLTWVSCLSASGMSIADMREYVRSGLGGERYLRVCDPVGAAGCAPTGGSSDY